MHAHTLESNCHLREILSIDGICPEFLIRFFVFPYVRFVFIFCFISTFVCRLSVLVINVTTKGTAGGSAETQREGKLEPQEGEGAEPEQLPPSQQQRLP